ncbi:sensor histidine kinase [Gillisia sp. CAL575]|uniref:sensor histidine kinase n=1 Tax=Gillisia sp. CAL575 TaxID=985255 RepID=UPI0003A524AA|nr:histidine kinase [Gillisia sp. CAL575]
MLAKEELLLIVYFIVVILLLTSFAIIFFITFHKRKNTLLYEKFEAEKRFENELAQSKIEIQEQTLKNVSWELHDNIGQLLSVANMQLNILTGTVDEEVKQSVKDIKEVVSNSLQEVRSLSKSLNNEVISYTGIEASIKNELSRFERLNNIKTEIFTEGETFDIIEKDSIILFRIIQEFFSNIIKHASASKIEVHIKYHIDEMNISIKDNGKGFNIDEVIKSSGLINMESRAALINTKIEIQSIPDKGTSLSLNYPKKVSSL